MSTTKYQPCSFGKPNPYFKSGADQLDEVEEFIPNCKLICYFIVIAV